MGVSTRSGDGASNRSRGGKRPPTLRAVRVPGLQPCEESHLEPMTMEESPRRWTERLTRLVREGSLAPSLDARDLTPERPILRPDRQALRDPVLDAELRSRGYVKVRLITREQAGSLRTAYGMLHGWHGEGYEPDPGNADVEYRARVREVVGPVIDPALEALFVDYRPFLQGYYCKWPDTPETHLHADWTSVDENLGHRSYIAWTALQDIAEDSGQMAVLPGSHAVDAAPRGSNVNLPLPGAWVDKEERIWQRMVRIPLLAGEALVFDMALIHASYTNSTALPRVAAVTCLRPEEADLVYFRGVDGGCALRYDIDEDFYLEMTPAELVSEPPQRLPSALVGTTSSRAAAEAADQALGATSRRRSNWSLWRRRHPAG
jgi:hypothetical protein